MKGGRSYPYILEKEKTVFILMNPYFIKAYMSSLGTFLFHGNFNPERKS